MYFLFLSCGNGGLEQYYAEYSDYEKITNKRLTGWFPEIVTRDCYELKSKSYLNICAFTSISYQNSKSLDSIFNSYKSVPLADFKKSIKKYNEKIPNWFVHINSMKSDCYNVIKLNNHVLLLREKNQVYSIWSLDYK